jgi:hypothetical protein
LFTVRFRDFWPGFNPYDNLFLWVLRDLFDEGLYVSQNPESFVDLEISSVYGKNRLLQKVRDRLFLSIGFLDLDGYQKKYLYGSHVPRNSRAHRNIWYTAENIPPIEGIYDGTISFKHTDELSNNLYFPYWMYRLDWGYPTSEFFEIRPKPGDLCRPRHVQLEGRYMKGVVFTSHRSPIRDSFISQIESAIEVDKFGSAYGRRAQSKVSTAERYLFQLCPENSFYPGYVTEKIIESWITGNLALWQGILNHQYLRLNENAFLDLTSCPREEVVKRISKLTVSEVQERVSQPLLSQEPSLDELRSFLKRILDTA